MLHNTDKFDLENQEPGVLTNSPLSDDIHLNVEMNETLNYMRARSHTRNESLSLFPKLIIAFIIVFGALFIADMNTRTALNTVYRVNGDQRLVSDAVMNSVPFLLSNPDVVEIIGIGAWMAPAIGMLGFLRITMDVWSDFP